MGGIKVAHRQEGKTQYVIGQVNATTASMNVRHQQDYSVTYHEEMD